MNEIIAEFEKRLTRYCKFESVVIPDSAVKDNPSASEINEVLKKEASLISEKISSRSYKICMCIEGKKLDSIKFADKISVISNNFSEIDFIIGRSHGLADEIKNMSDFKFSMSDLTFPHNIARLMLTEQIYRCFKILSNENYHK